MSTPFPSSEFNREAFPFLRGIEAGSFAEKTLSDRVPGIGRRTLQMNRSCLAPSSIAAIESLISEMPHGKLRLLLPNDEFPSEEEDLHDWNEHLQPYIGQSWLQVPWYVAETYFYRRLIEASKPLRRSDLFEQEKTQALLDASGAILRLSQIPNPSHLKKKKNNNNKGLEELKPEELESLRWTFFDLTFRALWANRADLSLWKPGDNMLSEATKKHSATLQEAEDNERKELGSKVLVDHTELAWVFLKSQFSSHSVSLKGLDIGFINDNCGIELIADMRLADFLLESGLARTVTFHLKQHGFFVSDAMPKDVFQTLDFLEELGKQGQEGGEEIFKFAKRLRARLVDSSWKLEMDRFWTSAKLFEEMPGRVRDRLLEHQLVIIKGDANYRRLAGERRYPHHLSFSSVAVGKRTSSSSALTSSSRGLASNSYFPSPVLALRTCKADIAVGIPTEKVEIVSDLDSEWLVNGRWGLIQFAEPQD